MTVFGAQIDKDTVEFCIQIGTLIVTVLTLLTTFYFTKQLVRNDNRRNVEVVKEALLMRIRQLVVTGLHLTKEDFEKHMSDILEYHKNEVALVIYVYHELHVQQIRTTMSFNEFMKMATDFIKSQPDYNKP